MNQSNIKQQILKMLIDNAEEPVDIQDGTGTFTTFRVEYLINDIVKMIDRVQAEAVKERDEEIEKKLETYLNQLCWSYKDIELLFRRIFSTLTKNKEENGT